MAYQFSTDDKSIEAGVRRIAHERLSAALDRADALPGADDVHELRKETKKLRGLLRLVKPRFKGFSRTDGLLRLGAAQLAPLRDAEVNLATFDTLTPALADPDMAAAVRALLAGDVERLRDPQRLAEATGALRDVLAQVRGEVDGWKVRGRGYVVLGEGLGATWRRAQRGLKASGRSLDREFDAEPFHDWRRSVKHHWYQARLLQPIWPEMMAPHIAAADALGEFLGDHNDLDVLAARLARDMPDALAPAAEAVTDAALVRRRHLAGQALVLGRRFLADPSRALLARWGRWWTLWRD